MANERQKVENIRYGGYTAKPSDYDSADGDLATAIGVVNEDGALKPVLPPASVNKPLLYDGTTLIGNLTVLFCHKNNGWIHYIGCYQDKKNNKLYYGWLDFNSEDGWEDIANDEWDGFYEYPNGYWKDRYIISFDGETHQSITAVGNMLIVSTDKHIHYFLYKQEMGQTVGGTTLPWEGYKYLGTEIPAARMEFALNGELVVHNVNHVVTVSDSKNTTTEGLWSVVLLQPFSSERGTVTPEKVDFEFAANTEYAVSLSIAGLSWQLALIKEDGTLGQVVMSANVFMDSTKRLTLTTQEKYIGFVFATLSKQRLKFTLTLEKGITHSTAGMRVIENNKDNFDAVMGAMNTFVNKYATKKNRFIYPFFVRYATKMYDGSYLYASPPILMRPNTGYVPLYRYTENAYDVQYAIVADLMGRSIAKIAEDWHEIIAGVDIFVSQPIYAYSQGEEFSDTEQGMKCYRVTEGSDIETVFEEDGYTYSCVTFNGKHIPSQLYGYDYGVSSLFYLLKNNVSFYNGSGSYVDLVKIAARDKEEIMDDVKGTSSFYKVASLSLDDFNDLYTDSGEEQYFQQIKFEIEALTNLVTREQIEDNLIGNRTMIGGGLFSYNKRLHIFSPKYRLPEPVLPHLQNGYYRVTNYEDDNGGLIYSGWKEAYVEIKTDELNYAYHKLDSAEVFGTGNPGGYLYPPFNLAWFFYPDNRALRVILVDSSSDDPEHQGPGVTLEDATYELPLKQHEVLNGAYWCADSLDGIPNVLQVFGEYYSGETPPEVNDCATTETSIYVSEVNNPFVFKSENVVNIDAGKIIGLCTAAKAMSTGQFGQFPLYVFTDNGVWAMELDSTGVYKATQPITRDVCVSAESITQLDGEVLFATDRGIMLLSGSQSTCLSDTLEADKQFVLTDNLMTEAQATEWLKYVNAGGGTELTLDTLKSWGAVSFLEYVRGCRSVYDYIHQRIIVYNPNYGYAYVYSLKSKSWGMIRSTLASGLNSYPEALAMDGDGHLVSFNETMNQTDDGDEEELTGINGLVVTRPMKFAAGDAYKTVDTIIQRGYFKSGHVMQVLYGSNDLHNWKGVWSSKDEYLRGFSGTPYKYFRLALVCTLDKDESLSGLTVRYEPRLTNRPR